MIKKEMKDLTVETWGLGRSASFGIRSNGVFFPRRFTISPVACGSGFS